MRHIVRRHIRIAGKQCDFEFQLRLYDSMSHVVVDGADAILPTLMLSVILPFWQKGETAVNSSPLNQQFPPPAV